jgi:hypothetical protein
VRPVGKHRYLAVPMAGYLPMRRSDRLAADPWLPFGHTGDVIAPRAPVPVHCDTGHDHAAYGEPGV